MSLPAYWLLKTEPETYSFDQLIKDKTTHWNNIRNFQARNFLRQMKKGDLALIYHSGKEKAVVGVAEIIKPAYPDPDPEGGDWSQVDLKALHRLSKPISLKTIKASPNLKEMLLVKQSRLSTSPLTPKQYQTLIKLGD